MGSRRTTAEDGGSLLDDVMEAERRSSVEAGRRPLNRNQSEPELEPRSLNPKMRTKPLFSTFGRS